MGCLAFGLRHWVPTRSTERMTPSDSTDGQPGSTPQAMLLHCDLRELGAGGFVPACGRQPGRDGSLVHSDQQQCSPLQHDSNSTHSAKSATSSSKLRSYAARLARTSKSRRSGRRPSAGNHCVRNISRTRRFNRFRSTMACPCLGTTMPSRGFRSSVESRRNTSKVPHETRVPERRIARISVERRRRADFGSRRRVVTAPDGGPGSDAVLPANFIAHR